MPNLLQAQVDQPRRVTARFVSAFGAQADLSRWSLLRGGVVVHPVAAAWTAGGAATVELALGDALLPGELYTLRHTDSAAELLVAWHPPVTPPRPAARTTTEGPVPDDPEAEFFGADIDWLAEALTPTGDLPLVRGLQAFRHDLAAVALLAPGELTHRPTAGVGLLRRVNGSGSPTTDAEMAADVRAAYLADSRVREAAVRVSREAERTLLHADVKTPVLPDNVPFTARV